jgi:adenine-specific DNA-methyltransferase
MSISAGARRLERTRVALPAPFYADDLVTLYHGRAEDVLPALTPGSVDVLLTDPPYFNVKDEDWDRQWKQRDHFLSWLGDILDAAAPALTAAASAWVFAGPLMATAVEREVVEPRLRVLNSIRWVKEQGWHQKAEIEAQRRYLTPWEAVILAERRDDAYSEEMRLLHMRVFAPIGAYLQQEREAAGLTRPDVEVTLGYTRKADPTRGTDLTLRWEEGSSLPTREAYERLRQLLGPDRLARSYDELRQWSEDLRRTFEEQREEYADLRRPFRLRPDGPVTDLWTFPPVMGYPGKHPCEKPLSMLRHMLQVSARPGALILDPFAGSGSTLRAAKDAGIKAIGIEKDVRWCRHAAQRLAQDALELDLGETA